jgi:hypothetical protein
MDTIELRDARFRSVCGDQNIMNCFVTTISKTLCRQLRNNYRTVSVDRSGSSAFPGITEAEPTCSGSIPAIVRAFMVSAIWNTTDCSNATSFWICPYYKTRQRVPRSSRRSSFLKEQAANSFAPRIRRFQMGFPEWRTQTAHICNTLNQQLFCHRPDVYHHLQIRCICVWQLKQDQHSHELKISSKDCSVQ